MTGLFDPQTREPLIPCQGDWYPTRGGQGSKRKSTAVERESLNSHRSRRQLKLLKLSNQFPGMQHVRKPRKKSENRMHHCR